MALRAPLSSLDLNGIPDGWYTVEGLAPNEGSRTWCTLRLRERTDRAGRPVRMLAVLRGPDNETDYLPVARVSPAGEVIWIRADRGAARARDAVRVLAGGDLDLHRQAYALRSRRCARCGRRLTVPESVRRGIGPECYKIDSTMGDITS